MSPDELRGKAEDLFAELADGTRPGLRPNQTILCAVPATAGTVIRCVWSPGQPVELGAFFFQLFRVAPDGEFVSASGAVRVGIAALPRFAAAIARALELAAEALRADPRRHHRNAPAPSAEANPSTTAPTGTPNGHSNGTGAL